MVILVDHQQDLIPSSHQSTIKKPLSLQYEISYKHCTSSLQPNIKNSAKPRQKKISLNTDGEANNVHTSRFQSKKFNLKTNNGDLLVLYAGLGQDDSCRLYWALDLLLGPKAFYLFSRVYYLLVKEHFIYSQNGNGLDIVLVNIYFFYFKFWRWCASDNQPMLISNLNI